MKSTQQKTLSGPQLFGLVFIFIQAVVYCDYPTGAKQDGWSAGLIAALVMVPAALLYLRLFRLNPGMDLFEILKARLGGVYGTAMTGLFIVYAVFAGALAIRSYTEFARLMILPQTPLLYITIFFGLLCLFLQRQPMTVLARYGLFLVPLTALVGLLVLLLSFDVMDAKRLLPVMTQPAAAVTRDAATVGLSAFGQLFILFALLPVSGGQTKRAQPIWWAYGLAAAYIVITALRAILVLGGEAYHGLFYSIYVSYSTLHIGTFVHRLEVLVSGVAAAVAVLRAAVFLKFLSLGAARLVSRGDGKIFSFPALGVCGAVSLLLYRHIADRELLTPWVNWASAVMALAAPALLWVISEVKKREGVVVK